MAERNDVKPEEVEKLVKLVDTMEMHFENDDLDISSSLQHSSTVAFGFLSRYSYTQSCISLDDFLFFLLVQKL